MIVKINYGAVEKIIGELSGSIFSKKVSKAKHLFRKYDAWGVDAKYFTDVLLPNNYQIKIYDRDEKKTYTISAEEFKKNGVFFHFKTDADYGAQIFCPRRYFTTCG